MMRNSVLVVYKVNGLNKENANHALMDVELA
jgi:hypothetical protein